MVPTESRPPSPEPQDRQPTVLLVEDEALIRIAVADYLRDCGFRVLEAANAAEAAEILSANLAQLEIDIVFTDVRMPGEMDGFGLARWIRANRPGLPALLGSGDTKKSDVARELCEEEGLFEKPYDVEKVVARMRGIINARDRT